VKDEFFKFPSTPHLWLPPDADIRSDKCLSAAERTVFLSREVVIEEKVDGANLGISFDTEGHLRTQNRGAYLTLPATGQWKQLDRWLAPRVESLFEHLTDRYLLFGEWCYAKHSIFYDMLPDWFLAFDLYDKQVNRFLSCEHRDRILRAIEVYHVPEIGRGTFNLVELQNLLSESRLGDTAAEGLYLRFDQDGWLADRAKLVRPAFIQAIEPHWTRSGIHPNRLRREIPIR